MKGYIVLAQHIADHPEIQRFVFPLIKTIVINLDAYPRANIIRISYSDYESADSV